MFCQDVAIDLTKRYHRTDPFDSAIGDIKSYLFKHGVLLSMNMLSSFAISEPASHISASWINALTNRSTIPVDSGIGIVLDAEKVDIMCLYPTDAATLGRDNNGCGPMSMDVKEGSNGAGKSGFLRKALVRKGIKDYKKQNFGDLAWEDIPCAVFYNLDLFTADKAIAWNEEGLKMMAPDALQFQLEAIMGHPVCNTSHAVADDDHMWFLYTGSRSWRSEEWQRVIDIQLEYIEKHPRFTLWNEIVLAWPATLPSIVSAVFFIPGNFGTGEKLRMQSARAQANVLGKPLLVLVNTSNGTQFVCYDEYVTLEKEANIHPYSTPMSIKRSSFLI